MNRINSWLSNEILNCIFLIICVKFSLINADCMEPYCQCTDSKTLCCNNFVSYEELNFRRLNGRPFESVEILPRPNTQLDLDEKLKFNGLVLNGRLTMSNIRSINAFYNPFKQILVYRFDLTIQNSDLRFFSTNQRPDIESGILNECSFKLGAQDLDFVFGNLKITEFFLNTVRFVQPVCPYLFKNSQISNLIITDPKDAFGFQRLKEEYNTDLLNVNIEQLYLNHTLFNNRQPQWLDSENILNYNLFLNTNRFNLNSAPRLAYIQENTFTRFQNLKIFEINNVNLNDLLSKSRRWLKNLNYMSPPYDLDVVSLNSSVASSIFQLIIWADDDRKWTFTEEKDICLFRNFPHNKLVFPFILFTNENTFKCTCTVYWLYKYFAKYQVIYNLNQNIVPYHCFRDSNWSRCKFDELFDRYCPLYIPDPDESFTTLRPTYTTHSFTSQYPTFSTNFPIVTTTPSTSPNYLTSTNNPNANDSEFKLATFYLAIFLSIICVVIISVLIVLFYEVFSQNKRLDTMAKPNNDVIYI